MFLILFTKDTRFLAVLLKLLILNPLKYCGRMQLRALLLG